MKHKTVFINNKCSITRGPLKMFHIITTISQFTYLIDWRGVTFFCDDVGHLRRHPWSIFSKDFGERNAPWSSSPVHRIDFSWSGELGSKCRAHTNIPALYPFSPKASKSGMSSSLSLALGMPGFRRHLLKAHSSIPDSLFSVVLDCKKQEKK